MSWPPITPPPTYPTPDSSCLLRNLHHGQFGTMRVHCIARAAPPHPISIQQLNSTGHGQFGTECAGFARDWLPENLLLALGTHTASPMPPPTAFLQVCGVWGSKLNFAKINAYQ
eukprot:354823-Chlamydomonas_euryale.AAC.2